MKPKTLILNGSVNNLKRLIMRIHRLILPRVEKLLVIFDDVDEHECLNSLFDAPAFFKNLKKDGRIQFCPNRIQRLIDINEAEYLIYVSKTVCESHPIKLAWIYSHEIQHLTHNLSDIELHYLGCFLYRFYGYLKEDPSFFEVPTELDCERTALSVVCKLFSQEDIEEYFSCLVGQDKTRHDNFMKFNPTVGENVKEEVRKIICANRGRFEELQREHCVKGKDVWIDFDQFCRENPST